MTNKEKLYLSVIYQEYISSISAYKDVENLSYQKECMEEVIKAIDQRIKELTQ